MKKSSFRKVLIEQPSLLLVLIECDVCGHEMFIQDSIVESVTEFLAENPGCPKCAPEAFQKSEVFQKLIAA